MDPRSPFVLSTHELGRQPGAMRKVERSITAPDDLSTPVIGVEAGSPIELDLRLEAVQEGVLVSGDVTVQTRAECVRCLREVEETRTVELSELYFYPGARQEAIDEGDEEAEDMVELEGELLDLEPVLRDAVVTALPLHPLCEPDCQGLCPGCGERMADLPADHEHVQIDPRWAALAGLASGEQDPDDDSEDS
ncbi:MAG TPA: DUF177 domain-containing protein [Actinomycetaceae bacterium]|nr:DUF177 domain-containing protein [Actinomycetaceae bacterium]